MRDSPAIVAVIVVGGACLVLICALVAFLWWVFSLVIQTIREMLDLVMNLDLGGVSHRVAGGPYERAEALMREVLDADEYRQLTRYGYVDFASPNRPERIYRVPRFLGRVTVYESGAAILSLCVQSSEAIPGPDVIVMHKLMILGDEAAYLAAANRFPPLFPSEPYYASRFGREPTLRERFRLLLAAGNE